MKYKLFFIISTFLLTSCMVKKEIKVNIIDAENVEVKPSMFGSTFDDVKPELAIPLLP